jgi:hypothetical protein
MRFAYADPPYPGTARRYYGDQPTYAGEVDHAALVASLVDAGYDGWALSTSAKALSDVLKLCPAGARVAAWAKPHPPSPQTLGMHNCWEPVIVVGGRRRRPGVSDVLVALPARGGGELPGRKPIAFCAWLFRLLGMQPGDELTDLFPGSGIIGRAWGELSRAAADDGCRRTPAHDDTRPSSPGVADAGGRQVSPVLEQRHPSREVLDDVAGLQERQQ